MHRTPTMTSILAAALTLSILGLAACDRAQTDGATGDDVATASIAATPSHGEDLAASEAEAAERSSAAEDRPSSDVRLGEREGCACGGQCDGSCGGSCGGTCGQAEPAGHECPYAREARAHARAHGGCPFAQAHGGCGRHEEDVFTRYQ